MIPAPCGYTGRPPHPRARTSHRPYYGRVWQAASWAEEGRPLVSTIATPVLARSSNAAALALIRLTNAASHLPYGSGETKGELPLRGQSEREALRGYCCAVSNGERTTLVVALQVCRFVSPRLISRGCNELESMG
jgi:hypothetical protein